MKTVSFEQINFHTGLKMGVQYEIKRILCKQHINKLKPLGQAAASKSIMSCLVIILKVIPPNVDPAQPISTSASQSKRVRPGLQDTIFISNWIGFISNWFSVCTILFSFHIGLASCLSETHQSNLLHTVSTF